MGHTPRCSGVLFMLDIRLDTTGLDRTIANLSLLTEKNLRFATGRAMRDTVIQTDKWLKADLKTNRRIQGGATAWTYNATYHERPSPTNLSAVVGLRTDAPRAAGRYISVLTKGGPPRTKGADLAASALVGSKVTMVPTRSQRKDSKGNVTRAAYTKALTGWASMRKTGTLVNRANRMFITPIKGAEGRFGIFERTGKPGRGRYGSYQGTKLRFTLEPQPKPRASTYDLKGDLQKQVRIYWPGDIERELKAELARAGFR
jgi:hypothetical protein